VADASPFDLLAERYDRWFDRHAAAYRSELLAVRALTPVDGVGLEIGVGSGRFAAPLGVAFGIDPARRLLGRAQRRRVSVARAVAEALPFAAGTFDYALVVTTICFVDDPAAILEEARRVLRASGDLVIGFIDRTSALGRHYLAHRDEAGARDGWGVFYRDARFFSAVEVEELLVRAGFRDHAWVQTLSRPPAGMRSIEPARPGRGSGAFLAVRASKG
jgi:SAM-dependent methyltransferase